MPELPTGTVTFLFTDIEGSTRLWEQHPEAMSAASARHDALLIAGIQQQGGVVVKSRGEGDSLFAVFAQAVDAVAAACALQQALLTKPWPTPSPLRVRMALHTAVAELRDGDYYGLGVNRCARLRAVAHGGQVLLSQATADRTRDQLPEGISLRDLGAHRLKDLQQPEHLFQLLYPALPADFPPLRSLAAFTHNMPVQLTRFIGREREMAEVKRLLAASHLLTLTGSGGCGKTRLALQVAVDLLEEYPDGVWLVELAPLADPALVPQTVASALGVREEPGRPLTATLGEYLRPKQALLILDNCEHLLAACAQLAESLLQACPKLRILASSREGLGIGGEQTYRVPSLSLPDARHLPPLARLREFEAVQLFADRARLSQASFAVTPANAPAVVQVCERLDGIPLAIELAAARVKALPVEKLNERLDDMFRLLTGGSRTALPRQQTLRALIDWSYELLAEAERALLRRLSVFAGGWWLEAAEAIGAGRGIEEGTVLDLLTALVEKSLVVYEEQAPEPRYRLLETVRQYARDRLVEAGEAEWVREQHLDFFLRLAEAAEPNLRGPECPSWMKRLATEHDNLRTALEWAHTTPEKANTGLLMSGCLWRFWHLGEYWREGRAWLERGLEQGEALQRTSTRARALDGVGVLALSQDEFGVARSRLAESRAIWQELKDKPKLAWSSTYLAWAHLAWSLHDPGSNPPRPGDPAEARFLCEESLAIFREVEDRWGQAQSLLCLGEATCQEEPDLARRWWQESRQIAQRSGDERTTAWSLYNLARLAFTERNDAEASQLYMECVALWQKTGDKRGIAHSLRGAGISAKNKGDYPLARLRLQEALSIWQQLGHRLNTTSVLGDLGLVARDQGDYATARSVYEQRLAIAEELSDERQIAWVINDLGYLAYLQGDHETAQSLLERSLRIRRVLGDRWNIAWSLTHLAEVALLRGDDQAAEALLLESLQIQRELGHRHSIASSLFHLGRVAQQQGNGAQAAALYRESLLMRMEVGHKQAIPECLEGIAAVFRTDGQPERAARLFGAAEALRETMDHGLPPVLRADYDRQVAATRTALSEEALEAKWAEGRAMSLEQAVAYALEEPADA